MIERHAGFLVPAAEVARRLASLQRALGAADVAAAWIEHPPDRLYFTGSLQDGVLLVPASGRAQLFIRKSLTRARSEVPGDPPEAAGVDVGSAPEVRAWTGRKPLGAALDKMRGSGRVGLAMDVSAAATYAWIREECGAPVVDITPLIRRLRAVKSEWEHVQLREAGRQATAIYGAARELIRTGMTELELTAAVEARLRIAGHAGAVRVRRSGAGIAILSAVSGESAFYPTPFDGCVGAEGPSPFAPPGAGWKKIAAGETVMLDMVTWWNGYHADHTRTWWVGGDGTPAGSNAPGAPALPEAARAAHEFCVEALARLVERIRPGARCDEIYRAIRAWADVACEPPGFMGHGENRVRFFGHGVGLELDELPVIADRIDMELEEGMVIAVEPKAFLPGIGAVGVENTYILTAGGPVSLCDSPLAIGTA